MAQLTGRSLIELQNIQLNTSAFGGFGGIGTLRVREDGIAFYKAKGAILGQALFGVLGAALTKNNTGAEPDRDGEDKSATAVPSPQTLMINGEPRTDLSAYNIGGHNFFKLRDLGKVLDFYVGYDEETKIVYLSGRSGYRD